MNTYMTNKELEVTGNGIITDYLCKFPNVIPLEIDIEHFIRHYLGLNISYESFADSDKLGFLSDGETSIDVWRNGKVIPVIFPINTIVIDRFLLNPKEYNRRRFTLAHEAAHFIISRMKKISPNDAYFHREFDCEKVYTIDELRKELTFSERQADRLGAILLMSRKKVEEALFICNADLPIKIYSNTVCSAKDKEVIKDTAQKLGVSQTALRIRLEELQLLEHHEISEYISDELHIGGTYS